MTEMLGSRWALSSMRVSHAMWLASLYACLHACLHACLPTCLHACLQTCRYACLCMHVNATCVLCVCDRQACISRARCPRGMADPCMQGSHVVDRRRGPAGPTYLYNMSPHPWYKNDFVSVPLAVFFFSKSVNRSKAETRPQSCVQTCV